MSDPADTQTRSLVLETGSRSEARFDCARLLVEEGPDAGREYVLPDRPTVVGRGEDADLRLDDETVSRAHFEVRPEGREWKLADLGSRSGTHVGELKVESVALAPDCSIRIGRTRLAFRRDLRSVVATDADATEVEGLLTEDSRMKRVLGLIQKLGPLDLPLLLLGEPGTGKERLARFVHEVGPFPEGPFEVVDCTLLGEEHMRSELFGHVKGAFTGAAEDREGAFVRADRGTVFLDEVGELPLDLQPALLRILEQGEVRPLGGGTVRKVKVRVVCATNRNLAEMVEAGEFRADLYHRLGALEVPIPPLRERGGDVRLLAQRFLPDDLAYSAGAFALLQEYPWPGNVRELRNRVTRAAALAEGGTVRAEDFGLEVPAPGGAPEAVGSSGATPSGASPAPRTLDEWTRHAVLVSMRRHDGNRREVAEELGISRTTLYRYLKRYEEEDEAGGGASTA